MEYGCIGEKLGHSFSVSVHNELADYKYELKELSNTELDAFLYEKKFLGINVTIPYKERVIPHLQEIDGPAKKIGAVNTVINKDGALFGYNTDFFGMCELITHAGVSPQGKKAVILGTGGTSKTARAVLEELGAREIITVSRTAKSGAVSYDELYGEHGDAEIIINTTPVGMFPNINGMPVDISYFPRLSGVIDAVYNPLRTELVLAARERGIPAEGGLYMLVAQAVRASEIFLDKKYPSYECERVYKKILKDKENAVLIGMPASGKSTVGRILAEELGLPFLDSDTLIEEKIAMPIPEYFARYGEEKFRQCEAEVIAKLSGKSSLVIATGGGAVLWSENIKNLRKNGKIFFLDRPLSELLPTPNRPTASTKEDIERRYTERYEIYKSAADEHIYIKGEAKSVADEIGEKR